jgi:hypothetical protein
MQIGNRYIRALEIGHINFTVSITDQTSSSHINHFIPSYHLLQRSCSRI